MPPWWAVLPDAIARRLVSARLTGGTATLVADSTGLDAAGRDELERTLTENDRRETPAWTRCAWP